MNRIIISVLIIWLTIIGYMYSKKSKDIFTYKDLGIKITTQTKTNQLKNKKNLVYNKNNRLDYIEVFFKDSEKDFEEEVQEKRLSSGCNTDTRIEEIGHPISSQTKGFQVIAINLEGDENCQIENESFYMDPQNPKKYYKFSYEDCAPGPCSIFKNIEFLE